LTGSKALNVGRTAFPPLDPADRASALEVDDGPAEVSPGVPDAVVESPARSVDPPPHEARVIVTPATAAAF
jgi:hypothetical protein